MAEKRVNLGGEYENQNVEIKRSTNLARNTLFELIAEKRFELIDDLLRLFNATDVPYIKDDFWMKVFIRNLSENDYAETVIANVGGKQSALKTPIQIFFHYLNKKREQIEKLKNEQQNLELIKFDPEHSEPYYSIVYSEERLEEWAIKELFPDWKSLINDSDCIHLCSAIQKWSEKWNLTDEWCLDFALTVIKEYTFALKKQLSIYDSAHCWDSLVWFLQGRANKGSNLDTLIYNVWSSALVERWYGFTNPYNERESPIFSHKWKDGIEVNIPWDFYSTKASEFKEKVLREFCGKAYFEFGKDSETLNNHLYENLRGISRELSHLEEKLINWIEDFEKLKGEELGNTPSKDVTHFYWLIDYQIPTLDSEPKDWSEISEMFSTPDDNAPASGKNENKKFEMAVKRLCKLMGLSIRSRTKRKPGRKVGSRDKAARHIVKK